MQGYFDNIYNCKCRQFSHNDFGSFFNCFQALLFCITIQFVTCKSAANNMSFPEKFLFAASTASYQIEGGWIADGKGENIWDRITHCQPDLIAGRANGDVACDSYYLYKEDIKLMHEHNFDVYRFSISWGRILPNGDISNINSAGIDYYNNVLDELHAKNISPMVTMYHWDLPQTLQDMGGWLNPNVVDYFEDYANLLFKRFGDRVKWWITINEPSEVVAGYAESHRGAPNLNLNSPSDYMVAHNLIKAHAAAYRLYEKTYKQAQKGKMSITLNSRHYMPKMISSKEDVDAAERIYQFMLGWFAHPIYSSSGDYPEIMREIVDKNSAAEGRRRSRLPSFTADEIIAIKGSFDFFGLNYYTSNLCSHGHQSYNQLKDKDTNVSVEVDPNWPETQAKWLKVYPQGINGLLKWIKKEYNNPPVFITENGYCDRGELNDTERIKYHKDHLVQILKAMTESDCNVIGYTVWSIIDNFEWLDAYENRFGLVHVDFNDPNRKRTPKASSKFFKEFLKNRALSAESI